MDEGAETVGEPSQKPVAWSDVFEKAHPAVGADDACDLAKPSDRIGDRAEHTGGEDGVEVGVWIGKPFDVGNIELRSGSDPVRTSLGSGEHRWGNIDPGDLRIRG